MGSTQWFMGRRLLLRVLTSEPPSPSCLQNQIRYRYISILLHDCSFSWQFYILGWAESSGLELCLLLVAHWPSELERKVRQAWKDECECFQRASVCITRGAFHIARLPHHLQLIWPEQGSRSRSRGFPPSSHLPSASGSLLFPSPRVHSDQCHTAWCRSVAE